MWGKTKAQKEKEKEKEISSQREIGVP